MSFHPALELKTERNIKKEKEATLESNRPRMEGRKNPERERAGCAVISFLPAAAVTTRGVTETKANYV